MRSFAYALIGWVTATVPAQAGVAELFGEREKDFGVTPRGPVLVHYFRFTNTTGQTLVLGSPRVSCGCVAAAVSSPRVAPGESAAVIAYMDTRRIPTPNVPRIVTVYVPFISPTFEEVTFRVRAVCREDLSITPDAIVFGTLPKGQGGRKSVRVTFYGDSNWRLADAVSTGGYVQAALSGPTVQGNAVSYEVAAQLDPACPAGYWICEIVLKSPHPATPLIRIPVTVTVTPPVVAARPLTVSFSNAAVGTFAEKRITLEADQPFRILQVRGADAQVQVILDGDHAAPTHAATIAVKPAVAGTFSRTVEFVTDHPHRKIMPVVVQVEAVSTK